MRRPARPAAAALALATAALLAGCGSAAPAARGPAPEAPPGGAPFLATSLATTAGTWAVAVMGGSVATNNNFWQLFARPPGSARWKLVTPPGTPDNGGLVLASAGRSLIAGFRPSQFLTYTPLSATADGGQAWASTGPLDGALADVPDALAAAPATGHLLALLADGTAVLAAPSSYASWTALTSLRSLAATTPGRRCGLRDLTAATFSSSGQALLAGTCGHRGTVGIFTETGGTWRAAGPPLPAPLAGQATRVLRLTSTANRTVALLAVGTGSATRLLAVWSADGGAHWTVSPPLSLYGAKVASASTGPGATMAIMLSTGHAQTIASPATPWQPLPALPAGTATLAPGPAGGWDALAVHSTKLAIWQLAPGSTAWALAQTVNVPIQFGSSG
jgi:hypothetical protein